MGAGLSTERSQVDVEATKVDRGSHPLGTTCVFDRHEAWLTDAGAEMEGNEGGFSTRVANFNAWRMKN